MGCHSRWGGIEWGIIANFSTALQFLIRSIFMNDLATVVSRNATTGDLIQRQDIGVYYICDQIGEQDRVCQGTINMPFPHAYKASGALIIVASILYVLNFIAFMLGFCMSFKKPDVFNKAYFSVVALVGWLCFITSLLSITMFATFVETWYYNYRPFPNSEVHLGGWYQMMSGCACSGVVACLLTALIGMMDRITGAQRCSNGEVNQGAELGVKS